MQMLALVALMSIPFAGPQQDELAALRKEVRDLRAVLQEEREKRMELEVQVRDLLLAIKELVATFEDLTGRSREEKVRPQPKVRPEEKPPEEVRRPERPPPGPNPEARRDAILAYQEAMRHLSEREFEAGVEKLSEALKGLPDERAVLYNRGWALIRLERDEEALRDFNRLIELGERGWDVYFHRGLAYHGLGQYDKGIDDFLKCTRMEPANEGNNVAYYNVGCAHALKGDKDEAIRFLKRAVEKGFDDFEHMEEDSDLESLHGDPRFDEILGRAREI